MQSPFSIKIVFIYNGKNRQTKEMRWWVGENIKKYVVVFRNALQSGLSLWRLIGDENGHTQKGRPKSRIEVMEVFSGKKVVKNNNASFITLKCKPDTTPSSEEVRRCQQWSLSLKADVITSFGPSYLSRRFSFTPLLKAPMKYWITKCIACRTTIANGWMIFWKEKGYRVGLSWHCGHGKSR
jgi:hypothetical protein